MLELLSINPSGMFAYGIHNTVRLNNLGICSLLGINHDRNGGSNGSGKSSFMYAITQLLFGKNPSGESGDDIINEFLGKFFGRLIFLDDNQTKWRITDIKKWRKTDKYPDEHFDNYIEEPSEIHNLKLRYSGTDLYLDRWDPTQNLWVDERSSNRQTGDSKLDMKATRKKILDIIKISYEQFMSIAYLAQQQSLRFTNGTHKVKLDVLSELCDLTVWDTRVEKIRANKSDFELKLQRTTSKLDGIRMIGSSLVAPDEITKEIISAQADKVAADIVQCDLDLDTLQVEKNKWVADNTAIDESIYQQMQIIRDITTKTNAIDILIGNCHSAYSDNCSTIRERKRPFEISQIETEIAELRGRATTRGWDLEQIMTGSGKCTKCFTIVTADHLLRHKELLKLEIDSLKTQMDTKNDHLSVLVKEFDDQLLHDLDEITEKYNKDKAELESQKSMFNTIFVSTNMLLDELKKKKIMVKEDPQHKMSTLNQKRLWLVSEQSQSTYKMKAWYNQHSQYVEYKTSLLNLEIDINQYSKQIKMFESLDRLFGDKGIKAYKLNNVLASLNVILKQYLDIITDGSVSVWVTQYREKSDGGVATDIQILVQEGNKKEVPFGLYSGGERQQIMLAFIGAFWQLASQYGSGVNILLLDEVFDSLDGSNKDLSCKFINLMKTLGKSSILVVTHDEEIKSLLDVDRVWTATKKNGQTTINIK